MLLWFQFITSSEVRILLCDNHICSHHIFFQVVFVTQSCGTFLISVTIVSSSSFLLYKAISFFFFFIFHLSGFGFRLCAGTSTSSHRHSAPPWLLACHPSSSSFLFHLNCLCPACDQHFLAADELQPLFLQESDPWLTSTCQRWHSTRCWWPGAPRPHPLTSSSWATAPQMVPTPLRWRWMALRQGLWSRGCCRPSRTPSASSQYRGTLLPSPLQRHSQQVSCLIVLRWLRWWWTVNKLNHFQVICFNGDIMYHHSTIFFGIGHIERLASCYKTSSIFPWCQCHWPLLNFCAFTIEWNDRWRYKQRRLKRKIKLTTIVSVFVSMLSILFVKNITTETIWQSLKFIKRLKWLFSSENWSSSSHLLTKQSWN